MLATRSWYLSSGSRTRAGGPTGLNSIVNLDFLTECKLRRRDNACTGTYQDAARTRPSGLATSFRSVLSLPAVT